MITVNSPGLQESPNIVVYKTIAVIGFNLKWQNHFSTLYPMFHPYLDDIKLYVLRHEVNFLILNFANGIQLFRF